MEEDKNAFMKKLLPLFLFFISINIFSQEYHFDYFIKQNHYRIKPESLEWITDSFYDSAQDNKLFLRIQDKNITASIFQKDKNLRHVFKVIQSGDNLSFIYKYSNQFNQAKKVTDYNKNNIIKAEKIDSTKYKITAFKNSKLKKKIVSVIVTLEKSDFNFTNINLDYNRTEEMESKLKELLNPDFKYIVKREQVEYSSGYIFDNSLIDIQKVDLTLRVPKELILKEYNYWSDFD